MFAQALVSFGMCRLLARANPAKTEVPARHRTLTIPRNAFARQESLEKIVKQVSIQCFTPPVGLYGALRVPTWLKSLFLKAICGIKSVSHFIRFGFDVSVWNGLDPDLKTLSISCSGINQEIRKHAVALGNTQLGSVLKEGTLPLNLRRINPKMNLFKKGCSFPAKL